MKYEVKFKDNTGAVRFSHYGTNIGERKQCSIPTSVNISLVQLKISFRSVAKSFDIKVVEGPIPKEKGRRFCFILIIDSNDPGQNS